MDDLDNSHIEDFDLAVSQAEGQQTEDWRAHKVGWISPSKFGDMMTQGKASTTARRKKLDKNLESGDVSQEYYDSEIKIIEWIEYKAKFGNGAKKYIAKIVDEKLRGQSHSTETFKQMEWGNDNEPIAAKLYEQRTGNKVTACGFLEHSSGIWGGSPDGLVGDEGIIEIKCPYDPANHTGIMLNQLVFKDTPEEIINNYKKDYSWQCHGYMALIDRKWVDFVTFDPRQDEALQMNIIRLERNEDKIKLLRDRIEEINEIVKTALLKIKP